MQAASVCHEYGRLTLATAGLLFVHLFDSVQNCHVGTHNVELYAIEYLLLHTRKQ